MFGTTADDRQESRKKERSHVPSCPGRGERITSAQRGRTCYKAAHPLLPGLPLTESDEILMERYARGDRAAFDELFRRYGSRLQAYFSRTSGRDDLATDFVQQTFLHLHRARADYRPGAPFRPWIYTIATNVRREHFRRAARRPETPLDPERHPEPSRGPDAPTASDRLLRRCLGELSEAQREVLILHWYQDIGFGEIAQMLGESETAVKVRAHRAYEKLREMLGAPRSGSNQSGGAAVPKGKSP